MTIQQKYLLVQHVQGNSNLVSLIFLKLSAKFMKYMKSITI